MSESEDTPNRLRALEKRMERLESMVAKLLARHDAAGPPAAAARPAQAADAALPQIDLDILYPKTEPLKPLTPASSGATAALERHPHVLEKIALLWGHPECGMLIERLFVDDRGDRKGFDKDVIEELMLLGEISRELAFLAPGKSRK